MPAAMAVPMAAASEIFAAVGAYLYRAAASNTGTCHVRAGPPQWLCSANIFTPVCSESPTAMPTSCLDRSSKYCPRNGAIAKKIMHNFTSVKPTPVAGLTVFNSLFFKCLKLIKIQKMRYLSVRKFIHKESRFWGDNLSYNKYLCSAKVISFTA